MEKNNKRILVLEDRLENALAAMNGLSDYGDVKIAGNYDDGLRLLEGYDSHLAFIDLNFPRKKGDEPEELGYEYAKELEKKAVPYAIVTAFVHGRSYSKIIVAGEEKCIQTDKDNKETWQLAYKKLMEIESTNEIIESKERCKRYTGKSYQK